MCCFKVAPPHSALKQILSFHLSTVINLNCIPLTALLSHLVKALFEAHEDSLEHLTISLFQI